MENVDEDFLLTLDYNDLTRLIDHRNNLLLEAKFWEKKIKHDFGSFYPEHYLDNDERLSFDQNGYERLQQAYDSYLADACEYRVVVKTKQKSSFHVALSKTFFQGVALAVYIAALPIKMYWVEKNMRKIDLYEYAKSLFIMVSDDEITFDDLCGRTERQEEMLRPLAKISLHLDIGEEAIVTAATQLTVEGFIAAFVWCHRPDEWKKHLLRLYVSSSSSDDPIRIEDPSSCML